MQPVPEARSWQDVTPLVLAGGLGTRLRSVVPDRPKVLAEVCGRPFLAFLLDQLAQAGCRRVVLCTGYRAEQVEAEFGSRYGRLELDYSREDVPLGTGGALRLALPLVSTNTLLVMNGDSYCPAPLRSFYQSHRRSQWAASLVATWSKETSRYGRLQLEPNDRILAFVEKAAAGGPGWINAGIYLMERRVIEKIPAGRAVSLEKEVLPQLVAQQLHAYRCRAPLLDIGVPAAYAEAERFFAAVPTAAASKHKGATRRSA